MRSDDPKLVDIEVKLRVPVEMANKIFRGELTGFSMGGKVPKADELDVHRLIGLEAWAEKIDGRMQNVFARLGALEDRLAVLEHVKKAAREQLKNLDLKRPLDEIEAVLLDRVVKLEDAAHQFENVIANGRTDFEEFESKLDLQSKQIAGAIATTGEGYAALHKRIAIIEDRMELDDGQ